MKFVIQSINFDNGDEINYPALKCPIVEVTHLGSVGRMLEELVSRETPKGAMVSSVVLVMHP